jgi:hypothetical protein
MQHLGVEGSPVSCRLIGQPLMEVFGEAKRKLDHAVIMPLP